MNEECGLIWIECNYCHIFKTFDQQPNHRFPPTGIWTFCKKCESYRMFFRMGRNKFIKEDILKTYNSVAEWKHCFVKPDYEK